MKIFQLKTVHIPDELTKTYYKALKSLLEQHTHGIRLEALNNENKSKIYSIRLNISDRLLLVRRRVDKQMAWIVVELIANHQYHKSKWLHGHTENNLELSVIELPLSDDDVSTCLNHQSLTIEQVSNYQNQFVVLSHLQSRALTAKLPLLIVGGAGSGKSVVGLELLWQWCQTEETSFFFCENKALSKRMQTLWQESYSELSGKVEFITYIEWLKHHIKQSNQQFVNDQHFFTWLGQEISYKPHLKKDHPFSPESWPSKSIILQEFRIRSGYDTESYLQLGNQQSLFRTTSSKNWLNNVYERYQRYLQIHNQIHPAFYNLKIQDNQGKKCVIDEGQDLSHLQLLILAKMFPHRCVLMDPHQRLHDAYAIETFLRVISTSCISLSCSYRNSQAAASFASELIAIKHLINEGTGDKYASLDLKPTEDAIAGHIVWYNSQTVRQDKTVQALSQTPKMAIIVFNESDYQSAAKLFPDAIIFVIDEIKGLEYEHIVLFNPFDLLQSIAHLIHKNEIKPYQHRSKNLPHESIPWFNQIIVAITRARESVYIISDTNNRLVCNNIIKPLQQTLARFTQDEPNSIANIAPASKEDWQQELARLNEQGATKQANQVEQKLTNFSSNCQSPTHRPSKREKILRDQAQDKSKAPIGKRNHKPTILSKGLLFDPEANKLLKNLSKNIKPLQEKNDHQINRNQVLSKLAPAALENILFDAIKQDRGADVYYLTQIDKRIALTVTNEQGLNPILFAAQYNRSEIILLLIDYGFDINATSPEGLFAIHMAYIHESLDVVELLLNNNYFTINSLTTSKINSLMLACENQSILSVKHLLKRNAQDNIFDHQGLACIHKACNIGWLSILKLLLEKEPNLAKLSTKTNEIALHYAAQSGYHLLVEELVKYRNYFDINTQNYGGWTALTLAVYYGHLKVVNILLALNISTVENGSGDNGLHLGCKRGHYKIIMALLASKKFNLNDQDRNGDTALMIVCRNQSFSDIAAYLISKGASLSIKNKQNLDAIDITIMSDNQETLRVLQNYRKETEEAFINCYQKKNRLETIYSPFCPINFDQAENNNEEQPVLK